MKCTVTYGAETWKFNNSIELKLISMKMDFYEEIGQMLKIRKNRNNIIREKLILRIRC